MKVTVYNQVSVTADVTWDQVASYLHRSGWELVQIGDWIDDVLPCFKVARWQRAGERATFFDSDDAETISDKVERVARWDGRQPGDVLNDIVGHPILSRGAAMVRKASAGANLVEARVALARVKPGDAVGYERARVRVAQAEAELDAVTRALAAAEGDTR